MRVLACFLVFAAFGCGSDDGGGGGDPPDASPDAMVQGAQNGLGQTCTVAATCPSDPPHECVFLNSGNPNLGYCSPICTIDADCTNGYTGPGTPTCFVPNQSNRCSVQCPTDTCPGDLVCADLGGGAVKICVTQ